MDLSVPRFKLPSFFSVGGQSQQRRKGPRLRHSARRYSGGILTVASSRFLDPIRPRADVKKVSGVVHHRFRLSTFPHPSNPKRDTLKELDLEAVLCNPQLRKSLLVPTFINESTESLSPSVTYPTPEHFA